jgi:predicted DNA-binding WGR domain protein
MSHKVNKVTVVQSSKSKEIQQGSINPVVRYFELGEGKTKLYWEISQLGTKLTICCGSIGVDAIQNIFEFKSFALARKRFLSLIDEMGTQGYELNQNQLYQPNTDLIPVIGSEPMPLFDARRAAVDYATQKGLRTGIFEFSANTELLAITGKQEFTIFELSRAVDLNLIYLRGAFQEKSAKSVAHKSKIKAKKSIKLNEQGFLKGSYSKEMDLRGHQFDSKIYLHLPEVFKKAAVRGRPPQANLYIANNEELEVLHLPSDAIGVEYVVIENLKNLREIHVGFGLLKFRELKWLILQNLPNLEFISIEGGLLWMDIHNAPNLKSIDLKKSKLLDHLFVSNAPNLIKMEIEGCVKLRNIGGISESDESRLFVKEQIASNQLGSKFNAALYPDMTYSDIDHVMTILNQGVKLATIAGNLESNFCYGQELNAGFNSFSFRLLRPLEHVYTGGTGEIYPYESIANDFHKNLGFGVSSSIGCSNQEECIKYALNTIINLGIEIPKIKKLDTTITLKFLQSLCSTKISLPDK